LREPKAHKRLFSVFSFFGLPPSAVLSDCFPNY
jgi:hypothetical protein